MLVCTRSVRVAAAANESATNGSSAWCPPLASQRSFGNGWSVTKHASNPAASIARAISETARAPTNSSPADTRSVGSWIENRIVAARYGLIGHSAWQPAAALLSCALHPRLDSRAARSGPRAGALRGSPLLRLRRGLPPGAPRVARRGGSGAGPRAERALRLGRALR